MRPNIDFNECLKDSPRFRASLEEAENDIDVMEVKLEKLCKLCASMIDAGKTFSNANVAFIGGVRDVAGYLKEDTLATSALAKFTHVLSEIQKYHTILLDQAHRSVCKNLNNFVKNDIRKVRETRKHFERVSNDLDAALIRNAQTPRSRPQPQQSASQSVQSSQQSTQSTQQQSQKSQQSQENCLEVDNVLTATRAGFRHTLLDYVYQINILYSKKRFDVLDTMLSFMNAQSTFFHQGQDMFDDLDPFMKEVRAQLEVLGAKAAVERKEMEERHASVQQSHVSLNASLPNLVGAGKNKDGPAKMEGYLFKRTTNAFKTWVRRWFSIENNQLVYRKRSKDSLTVMEDDLRFCSVKPSMELDRRFCFEVVSPTRSHQLQADSEAECLAWISAIQAGVSQAYNNSHRQTEQKHSSTADNSPSGPHSSSYMQEESTESSSTDTTTNNTNNGQSEDDPTNTLTSSASASGALSALGRGAGEQGGGGGGGSTPNLPSLASTKKKLWEPKGVKLMKKLLSIAGNSVCCDCGTADPRWASINLGITLCIECSGIHRSFGVHVSKVRSVTLDAWEPELLSVMSKLGNAEVNRIYLATYDPKNDPSLTPATPNCDRGTREAWVRAKYIDKRFVKELGQEEFGNSKQWSVQKPKRRKSPAKETPTPTSTDPETTSSTSDPELASPLDPDSTSAGGEVVVEGSMAQGKSQDSGLGGSANDVLFVFSGLQQVSSSGAGQEMDEQGDLDVEVSSLSSGGGGGSDVDSTTSCEDVSALSADLLLFRAAQARNLPVMRRALALGADINWSYQHRAADDEEAGKTPLIKATETGDMAPTEFLLLNGAKVDMKDHRGRTPLHHATQLGHTGQVCQFLKRNANQHAVDLAGDNPLSIAVKNANADIVTLLRLAKLNEEMKETEGLYGGQDETFNEVFRDFTNMANNAPEKLNRNRQQPS